MKNKKKIKIAHIISGLKIGGAERMLFSLLSNTNIEEFDVIVISLQDIGDIGEDIRNLGFPVYEIKMNKIGISPRSLKYLVEILKNHKPNVIHTWMYHADLIGGIIGKFLRTPKIIWHLHNSKFPDNKPFAFLSARIVRWINARISHFVPDTIVSCSFDAKIVHSKIGYQDDKFVVIPNGFDLSVFKYSSENRKTFRRELQVPDQSIVIGMIARFTPQKDYATMIRAANKFLEDNENVYFVFAGENVNWNNSALASLIDSHKVDSYRLLGLRNDISELMSALDIFCLISRVEAFPIVIGEAMSTEIPSIGTDVGDMAYLIGDTGLVVQPGNNLSLFDALQKLTNLSSEERKVLGRRARQRIVNNFEIKIISDQFFNLYRSL